MSKYRRIVRLFGYRGLWCWLLAAILRQRTVTMYSRHLGLPVTLRRGASDFSLCYSILQRGEYAVELGHPVATIIDAGSNIGLSVLYFHHKYPDARIIALEPDPGNFELLEANVSRLPGVTTVNAALWSEETRLSLFDPGNREWGYQVTDARRDGKIPAYTVEGLMNRFDMTGVDFLKIDIEGAEKEVMEVADPWIDRITTMAIELHDRFKPGCSQAFFRHADAFDYQLELGENLFVSRHPLRTGRGVR